MARDFDRIHKSVRWPYTYDNTDYSWRTRLTVRPQDFHSWNSSSILLCATNKKSIIENYTFREVVQLARTLVLVTVNQ